MAGIVSSNSTTLHGNDNADLEQILAIIMDEDFGWNTTVAVLLPNVCAKDLIPLQEPLRRYAVIEFLDLSVLICDFNPNDHVLGYKVTDRWELGEEGSPNGTFVYIFPAEYFAGGQKAQEMLWGYLDFIKNH